MELCLNNKLIGKKSKQGDNLFVRFNGMIYRPGALKAVSKLKGKKVMETVMRTAREPYKIVAELDRNNLKAHAEDLAFVKISILDKNGNLVPRANIRLTFNISGPGTIAALDNGYQADLEPFSNKKFRNSYNGLALAIVRPAKESGEIVLNIKS